MFSGLKTKDFENGDKKADIKCRLNGRRSMLFPKRSMVLHGSASGSLKRFIGIGFQGDMFIDEGIKVEVRGRITSGRVIRRHRFILLTNHDGFVKLGVVEVEAKETEFISDLLPFGFMDEGDEGLIELSEAHEDVRLAEHTE